MNKKLIQHMFMSDSLWHKYLAFVNHPAKSHYQHELVFTPDGAGCLIQVSFDYDYGSIRDRVCPFTNLGALEDWLNDALQNLNFLKETL